MVSFNLNEKCFLQLISRRSFIAFVDSVLHTIVVVVAKMMFMGFVFHPRRFFHRISPSLERNYSEIKTYELLGLHYRGREVNILYCRDGFRRCFWEGNFAEAFLSFFSLLSSFFF